MIVTAHHLSAPGRAAAVHRRRRAACAAGAAHAARAVSARPPTGHAHRALVEVRRLVVSASRVVEAGDAPFVSVAVAVDDAEPLELAPGTARRLAPALMAAVDGTEALTSDD